MFLSSGFSPSLYPRTRSQPQMVVGDGFSLVCVGGVTNGGKTSLTTKLRRRFPHLKYINQDDFFLKPDDPRHVWVENSEFRSQNWEIPESVDFQALKQKVIDLTRSGEELPYRLIVLEGHLLYADPHVVKWSDLNYFFTLTREQCWERRKERVYDPPDPPGYFDAIVFPEYLKLKGFVDQNIANVEYIDGSADQSEVCDRVANSINQLLKLE
ncbi:nicotinamide riboside kinase 1 [Galendromus occidentalis]|uniref:Nicotinamide riboside kinase 1 n=1 Tax=Galendromus occidentalis TaxID=34638 RepID=A0AAJ7SHQ5_9ACAR|nr:nicotinamide riboside kinase 1 [Galendromus occidentalis]